MTPIDLASAYARIAAAAAARHPEDRHAQVAAAVARTLANRAEKLEVMEARQAAIRAAWWCGMASSQDYWQAVKNAAAYMETAKRRMAV